MSWPTVRVQVVQRGDPQPGAHTYDADGQLIVCVPVGWEPDDQLPELAALVRQAPAATIVSASLETARKARSAVQHSWSSRGYDPSLKRKPTPKMRLPPAPTRAPRGRCGAPRSDGEACRAWAGAGTMSRVGPCARHGGQAVDHKKAEELAEHALAWIRLNTRARTEELTPTEQLVSLTAARALLVARRDGLLG